MVSIKELMMKFKKIGPGINKVGIGPFSPQAPDKERQLYVLDFIEEYAFLKEDSAYIEFLKMYCGAFAKKEDRSFVIDIFGLFPRFTHIIRDGNNRIDIEKDFFLFSLVLIPKEFNLQVDFAFNTSKSRKKGIYRIYPDLDHEIEWFCHNFYEWLEMAVGDERDLYH